jgi:hypothetical protein
MNVTDSLREKSSSPVGPHVVAVDGHEVVEAGSLEQCGVERVVGVVMAEHHVGHVSRRDAECLEGVQDG